MKVRPSVVILEGYSVLLMRYIYGGTEVYSLPGGNPDPMETLQQAVERELMEELGLKVEVQDLLFVAETHKPEKQEIVLHHIFEGKILDGIPKIDPTQTSALSVEWIEVDKLDDKNLYPNIGTEIRILLGMGSKDKITYLGNIDQQWF